MTIREKRMLDERQEIQRGIFDPGNFVKRNVEYGKRRWEGDRPEMEPLHVWEARAVQVAMRKRRVAHNARVALDGFGVGVLLTAVFTLGWWPSLALLLVWVYVTIQDVR